MADKKIVDLDPIVTLSGTDLRETSLDGTGSVKETRSQEQTYMQNNLDFIHTTGSVTAGDIPIYGADGKNAKSSGANIDTSKNLTNLNSVSVATDPATANQLVRKSYMIADNIPADTTPVNYIPVDTSIKGNLEGIDNALGSLGGDTVSFSVDQTVSQAIAHNVLTLVNFQAKNFDTGGYFDTTTMTYTPLVPGAYLFIFQGAWSAPPADATVQFYIKKNSTTVAQTLSTVIPNGSLVNIPPLVALIEMNGTTDFIQVYASQTNSTHNAVNLLNANSLTWFEGALLNQRGSNLTPSTLLQTIYYSTKGSDIDGDGTLDFPFLTPNYALTYALTLTRSVGNPINIHGDSGTYSISNGALLYPNINWIGDGITFTAGGASSITYAPNSAWTTTASKIYISGITIDSTMTVNLDTTGFTNFKNTLHLQNFNSVANTTFKFGSSTHTGTINLDGNVQLASGSGSTTTIDSVFVVANPGHQMSLTGAISMLATNNITSLQSIGNTGMGLVQITSSTTRSINFQGNAGNQIDFSIDATKAGGVTIILDDTTLPPAINGMITGTNYSFLNQSANSYLSQSTLTDGSSVTWDVALSPSAILVLTGNGHTISPLNAFSDCQALLTIQQNGTGGFTPTFNSNFQFPLGMPWINTAPNAATTLQFISIDATNLICISPPPTATVVSGTSQTLAWGTTYYSNNTALTTFTLPSASFPVGAKTIRICGINTGGWTIAQNSGQTIIASSGGVAGVNQTTTGTGGSISSTDPYDMIEIIPQNTNTAIVTDVKGNLAIV